MFKLPLIVQATVVKLFIIQSPAYTFTLPNTLTVFPLVPVGNCKIRPPVLPKVRSPASVTVDWKFLKNLNIEVAAV